jgi:GTP-binding protein
VALLLFDPFDEQLSHQDRALAGVVKEADVATILVANKYDLAASSSSEADRGTVIRHFEQQLRNEFPFFAFAPLLTISANEKWRITKLLDLVLEVQEEKQKTLDEQTLQSIFKEISHELGMTRARTRKTMRQTPKLGALKQTKSNPPEFSITTTRHGKIPFSIVKIIEKHIRALAGFTGVPIKIHIQRE